MHYIILFLKGIFVFRSDTIYLFDKSYHSSYNNIQSNIKLLDHHLSGKYLDEINTKLISEIAISYQNDFDRRYKDEKIFIANSKVDYTLSVLSAVLDYAHNKLEWIDSVPFKILPKRLTKNKRTPVWLTAEEELDLLAELPPHLKPIFLFTLETGLKESTVTSLEWKQFNLEKRTLLVYDKRTYHNHFQIPLSDYAIKILMDQRVKNSTHIFTYRGKPIKKASSTAWKKALDRAGIAHFKQNHYHRSKNFPTKNLREYKYKNFIWSDLQCTWVYFHVKAETHPEKLQLLTGWSYHKISSLYSYYHFINHQNILNKSKH